MAIIMIIVGSLVPQLAPPEKHHIDKLVHFTTYLIFSFLPTIFFKKTSVIFLSLIILASTSIAIEIMQTHIPGRSGSFGDAAANISGIIIGTLIGFLLIRRKRQS